MANLELNLTEYNNFPNSISNKHFFIKRSSLQKSENTNFTNCRNNIAKVICLVDPAKEGEEPEQRIYQRTSKSYAIYVEKIYDDYPTILQKMFCSLRHIFIEKIFLEQLMRD